MSRKEKGYRSSLAHSMGNGQNTTDIEDNAVDGPKSEIQHGLRRFSKRTCIQFVPTKNDRERCGCGLGKRAHSLLALRHIPSSEITWNPLVNTGTEPTDAYGQIEFSGAGQTSRAKYIRIAHDTDADTVLKNVFEKEWKLKLPKLLISVTGGAKSFVLHPKLKQVLRQGLLKAAKTTGAWIITGGTNTGVMKHVGEAVRGQTVTSHPVMDDDTQLHLIGVATWGIIEHKESLIDNKDTVTYHMTSSMASSGACLDNNHTHFILVDNGSQGQYGVEIPFRASLENAISKRKMSSETKHGIPVVLLVLEGGPNTIRTVLESVTRSPAVPVVIAEGSGRAADILAFAHRFIVENEGPEITELQDLVEHRQLLQKIELAYPGESEESVLDIYKNVLKCVGNKRFITIFRVDEEGIDIDKAILKALLKAEHASAADQLSLALVWNRADIAMSEIFIESHRWKMEDLEAAMMDALKNDRVEFVSLLLENGVGMGRFLTKERLFTLYKERSKISVAFQEMIGDSKLRTFTLQDIDCVIDKMLGGSRTGQLAMGFDESIIRFTLHMESESQHPFDDLFLWAVLCNMHKMAVFMWERGGNNLACALVGAKLYMEMASRLEGDELRGDVYEQITANAKEFKDVALSLLDECSRANEVATQKLLTYHLADWCGHTCLSLAIMTEHQEFVAHASCQSLLTEIWMGAMRNLYLPSLKVILGIMVPPTIYFLDFKTKRELSLLPVTFTEHQTEMDGNDSSCSSEQGEEIFGEKRKKEKVVKKSTYERKVEARSTFYGKSIDCHVKTLSAGRKLLEFYRAPITKFWANVIAYLMFLMLFSYVIVVTERSYPLIAEIVLIVFVCSLCTEEIRQICQSDVSTSNNKFIAWASSKWNICDGLAVVFFFVGLGLRFNEPTAAIGHVVYSLDIMLWIIRLLDIFSVSKHLGPYVVMIGRMTVDMLYFLLIMVVFLLAYGVAQQAILFPKERGSWGLISKIFFRPYFQTYGELFITDPIQLTVNSTTTEFDTPKHDEYSGTIATVIMAFYLLVANILLLNLLIAIFNNTFSEIQANSNQIWKFQRYDLIMEYAQRPVLVPPLIILNHVIELLCCCWNGLCCCRDNRRDRKVLADNRLKLFLDKYEKEELLMFEEHCLYLYLHHKDTLFNATSEERVRVIGNRVDFVASQLDEMARETFNRDTNTNKTLLALTGKVKTLENNTKTILKLLTSLHGLNPERFGITDSDDEDVRSAKGSDILSYFGTKRAKLSGDRSPSPVRRTAAHAKEAFCTLRSKSVSPPIVPESKRRRRSEGSPSTSPVVPLGDVLPRATRSPSKYTAIRKPKRSHDIDEADFTHNIKSTRSPYPMTTIERYSVNEQELDWENLMPWYSPPCYTADAIIAASTDPDLHSISADDVKISFNEFDGNINRKSHTGRYDVINGLPRNPAGRTGLVGRGLLEYWGPNRIAWHIITRWRKKDDGDIESRGKRKVLEFMAWKTGTNQKWSLPEEKQVNVPEKSNVEGVVLEVVSDSFKKQFIDNITLAMSDSLKEERYHKEKLIREQLFQQGNEVYRGYLDDERNTDNAWMEIVVTNFHDDTGEILNSMSFTETNDAYSMAWFMVSGHIDLPENHVTMLGKVARIHKSYF